MRTVGQLFLPEPLSWGLRGDPYLWRALAARFDEVPLPIEASALSALLEEAFAELTGRTIHADEPFKREDFAHGGMSSGGISPAFWRDVALPLLLKRYGAALD